MLCFVFISHLLVTAVCSKRTGGSIGRKTGAHYPPATGLSGNTYKSGHTYPHSTGYSGNNVGHSNYYSGQNPSYNSKQQIHHHYHYNPPPHISYGATQHPVYHGTPPVYIYEYRNSGSRYDSLLTGLALYNLGRMSTRHDSGPGYRRNPGETCKLRIERNRSEYEETRIDCMLISSFMEIPTEKNKVVHTIITTNITQSKVSENGSNSNITVTTVQNTTVVDALAIKGPSVQLTPDMQCFVIRVSGYSTNFKRKVECGLLQEYARRSMYNGCSKPIPYHAIYVGLQIPIFYLSIIFKSVA